MKLLSISLLLLSLVLSGSVQGQENPASTRAGLELTREETDWWQNVQIAVQEVSQAAKEMDSEIASFKKRNPKSSQAEISEGIPAETFGKFTNAKQKLGRLLTTGIEKNYRVPVKSAKVKALFIPPLSYTNAGRKYFICGKLTIRMSIAATGIPDSAAILNSIRHPCPNYLEAIGEKSSRDLDSGSIPRLGPEFDKVATETAMGIVFFPAIENHRFTASTARIEMAFNLY
jgi:hypothetical protein